MFPSLYLLIALAQMPQGLEAPPAPPAPPPDQAQLTTAGDRVQITWADAEDRVRGSLGPAAPFALREVEVSVHVGSFDGPEFAGPVTLTLKPSGSSGPGSTKTVPRGGVDKDWRATLTAGAKGPHTLEIAFTTTRHKVVRGQVQVVDAPLPRWPWFALLGAAGALALAFGVRAVLARKDAP